MGGCIQRNVVFYQILNFLLLWLGLVQFSEILTYATQPMQSEMSNCVFVGLTLG